MAAPLVETIEDAVEALLRAVSTANGYNYDYMNTDDEFDIRKLEDVEGVHDFPRLYCPPDLADEGPAGTFSAGVVEVSKKEREKQVPVLGYVSAETGTATMLNLVRQDIERALFSVSMLGLAASGVTNFTLSTIEKWQDQESQVAIIRLTFVATYRYTRGTP
jgi:hypothetical protein